MVPWFASGRGRTLAWCPLEGCPPRPPTTPSTFTAGGSDNTMSPWWGWSPTVRRFRRYRVGPPDRRGWWGDETTSTSFPTVAASPAARFTTPTPSAVPPALAPAEPPHGGGYRVDLGGGEGVLHPHATTKKVGNLSGSVPNVGRTWCDRIPDAYADGMRLDAAGRRIREEARAARSFRSSPGVAATPTPRRSEGYPLLRWSGVWLCG